MRGRLSGIDLLPDEARPVIDWCNEQLKARRVPQTELLVETNQRLADLGLPAVSSSSFNRHSISVAGGRRRKRLQAGRQFEVFHPETRPALVEALSTPAVEVLEEAFASIARMTLHKTTGEN